MVRKDKIPLRYHEEQEEECSRLPENPEIRKTDYGTSSLYGRTERNITYVQRGVYNESKFDNAFPGAYFNILKAFFRMIAMFIRAK